MFASYSGVCRLLAIPVYVRLVEVTGLTTLGLFFWVICLVLLGMLEELLVIQGGR